jgi:hypothetical protein
MNSSFLSIVQSTADVLGDIGRSALLAPVGQFHDGGFEGELVFVDLEEQGREQVGWFFRWQNAGESG